MFAFALSVLLLGASATAKVVYEGRIPLSYTAAQLDASAPPFTTVVRGSQNASYYSKLQGTHTPPTPLWQPLSEQALAISIDNTSVFVPGGLVANSQWGFRRTELIAQNGAAVELGTTVHHFSIKLDTELPLNYKHEYQIVFIELNNGTHVFEVKLGSSFTIPEQADPSAHLFRVLDHAQNVIFSTTAKSKVWHNFGIQIDWDANTLAVLYSHNENHLKVVTKAVSNNSTSGQGDFHWGVLKLPLPNPNDSAAQQSDVVHHGIQEGTKEALIYSGVFVEDVQCGISIGGKSAIPKIE